MKALSARYPIWFCDVWGVIHNGYEPFASAVDALVRHRQQGGVVILLTNSPRSRNGVEVQLDQIGVPRTAWDAIVTSGDVTRQLMLDHSNGKLFHIGPSRDVSLFQGLNVERVDLADASAVICTGLVNETEETAEDYRWLLIDVRDRGLPFICANPDKIVRKGVRLLPCAGALAELHTQIGGKVLMAGKPFAPVYELALRTAARIRGKEISKAEVLAIGDGIDTDIKGAADNDLDAVLVTGGINKPGDDPIAKVQKKVPNARVVAVTQDLEWA